MNAPDALSAVDRQLANWFEHRHWRVKTEVSGVARSGDITVTYDRGAFVIEPPGVFVSPLGTRGRRGFVLVRTDGAGSETVLEASFGEAHLRRAQAAWGTIDGLPEPEES